MDFAAKRAKIQLVAKKTKLGYALCYLQYSCEGWQVALDEFDCIVLGDEPAGLWLLTQLEKQSRQTGAKSRFGYLRLSHERRSVPFFARLAPEFDLDVDKVWHAEILTPSDRFLWEEKALEERFPSLSVHDLVSAPLKTSARHRLARAVIAQHPELFLLAKGVWKYFGRTDQLRAETLLLGALMATDLCSWDPWRALPETLEQFHLNAGDHPVEEIRKVRSDAILFKCRGKGAWLTKKLIINCSLRQLAPFCAASADLLKWIGVSLDIVTHNALYPFKIEANPEVIPFPVQPLSFYFETTEIPDIDREVWPLEISQEHANAKSLTFWVTGHREVAPELLSDRFKAGMQVAHQLFPHLAHGVQTLALPLETGDCFSESVRSAYYDYLEPRAQEQYGSIYLEARTRLHPLLVLSPFVHCHLPYPLGPLQQAQKTHGNLANRQKTPSLRPSGLME